MPVYANSEPVIYANSEPVMEKEEQLTQIVHEISAMASQNSDMVKRISSGLFNDSTEVRGDSKEPRCLMEELLNVRSELAWAGNATQVMLERLGI